MAHIHAAAEMSYCGLKKIAQGQTRFIQRDVEARILDVSPARGELSATGSVLALGSARRLQALHAMGFTRKFLGEHCSLDYRTLDVIAHERQTHVLASTASIIRDLFDRFHMTDPNAPMLQTKEAKLRRTRAAKKGWLPPLAWDESDMDDPNAKPLNASRGKGRPHGEWVEDYLELKRLGITDSVAAERLGVALRTIERYKEKAAA